jgi:hypothetical protein
MRVGHEVVHAINNLSVQTAALTCNWSSPPHQNCSCTIQRPVVGSSCTHDTLRRLSSKLPLFKQGAAMVADMTLHALKEHIQAQCFAAALACLS